MNTIQLEYLKQVILISTAFRMQREFTLYSTIQATN
jgi:hypothetical protein